MLDQAILTDIINKDTGILVSDFYTGQIIECNDAFASFFNIQNKNIIGKYCYELFGFTSRCNSCPYNKLIDDNNNPKAPYIWKKHFKVLDLWIQGISSVHKFNGRLIQSTKFIDITEQCQIEEDDNSSTYEDSNLHIPNSIFFERQLMKNYDYDYLLALDIEELRKINDFYGRPYGDALLEHIRDYINELNIPNSSLYRLEFSDFGILFKNINGNIHIPKSISAKLYERCEKPWLITIGKQAQNIYISINICIIPLDGTLNTVYPELPNTVEYILDIARKTRSVSIYDDNIIEGFRMKLRLELSLKNAVRENMSGFYLLYQPIIDPGVAKWSKVEVLCRWNSPELGPVPPDEFIPIAESSGLISNITSWILEEAITQIQKWKLDELNDFYLSVILSPIQITMKDMEQIIVDILKQYNYSPSKLCLEIIESNQLDSIKQIIPVINRLHETGVLIALDDFGTKYASLNLFHKLPVQIVKTDPSFINDIESDTGLQHLFYIIVELAHKLGMKIIVEGVETSFQAQFLLKEGIDYFQGYLFSYPLMAMQMEKQLHNFHNPSSNLVTMGYAKFDLSKLVSDQSYYTLSSKLYKTLSKCMKELLYNPDGYTAIDTVLAYIGNELKVSRSYLFLNNTDNTFSNTHEWCAKGIQSVKNDLQNIVLDESSDWFNLLKNDGIIISHDVKSLPSTIRELLELQEVQAIAVFPIWKNNNLHGFVGFDHCKGIYNWTREDVQMLHTLTEIIYSTINKLWLQNQLISQSRVLENVLHNMNTLIYVTDLETNKILFANSEITRLYGKPLTGNVCWQVLQDCTERCAMCPVPDLLNNIGEIHQWEYYNTILDRYYQVRDIIISWTENKLVHLQYAEDITKLKTYQSKLEVFATTDRFTSTLNRVSFMEAATDILEKSEYKNMSFTIAFIDIDNLKDVNDSYGHAIGDQLICHIVEALSSNINDTDLIGRYGGDEFVIALYNCSKAIAMKKMAETLKHVEPIQLDNDINIIPSFSFGLAENTDIGSHEPEDKLKQLIDIADEHMFVQKNKRKKKKK